MSSSVSADYSPASNYSYPTDLTLSPSSPARQTRSQADQAPPPRLSSPNFFREIFSSEGTTSTRSPHRLPPLDESFYVETMQGVIPAIQSASRAIQTAQEAFQTSRTPSASVSRRHDFVDLTNSPPAPTDNRPTDSFLMRTLHPHDSRSSNFTTNPSLHQPFYPNPNLSRNSQSLFVEETEDPNTRYPGQSDSLSGARRRHEFQRLTQRRPYMILSEMERFLRPGNSDVRRQEEEDAIRRQRAARQTWEQNRQRQYQREQERDRLQQQRERLVARNGRQTDVGGSQQSQPTSQETGLSSGLASQTMSSPPRPRSSSSATSSSSVEAIDLTEVNNTTDLTAALLHSQSNNPVADPGNPDSAAARSALTAYKCPICLEPPRNATTTICGHLFCHECILMTLKNSENIRREDAPPHRKVKGQCPVCRKELARKEGEGQTRTLVPLEIKLISKKKLEELRRLERKRERVEKSNRRKNKGKEKALDDDATEREIFQLSSDEDELLEGDPKSHSAKRVKFTTSEDLDDLFGSYTYQTEL